MDDSRAAGRPATPPHILVVEDDAEVRQVATEMLESAGYAVRAVASGPRALTAVAAERPALILLDLGLPMMDGWQVLQRLQAEGDMPLVVLMTAYSHLAARALDAGAVATMLKPFAMDDLLSLVARVLGSPTQRDAQR